MLFAVVDTMDQTSAIIQLTVSTNSGSRNNTNSPDNIDELINSINERRTFFLFLIEN